MSRRIAFFLAATVLLAVAPMDASWATTTSQALALCTARGTDCSVTNKGGDYEICVNNSSGRECVKCPNLTQGNQTCTVARSQQVRGTANILKGSAKKSAVRQ